MITYDPNYLQQQGLTGYASSIDAKWPGAGSGGDRRTIHNIVGSCGHSVEPRVLQANMDQCTGPNLGAQLLFALRTHRRVR